MSWKKRLSGKFVVAAILLTLIPMLIVGAIGFFLGRQGIRTHTDLHLQSVVELKSEQVLDWVELQKAGLRSHLYPAGSTEAVDRLLGTEVGTRAHDETVEAIEASAPLVADDQSLFKVFLLLGAERTVQYSSNPRLLVPAGAVEEAYEEGSRGFYMGLTWEPPASPETPLIVIAEPTLGEVAGVAAAYLDPSTLQRFLRPDAGLGASGRIYLAQTQEGTVSADGLLQEPPGGAADILGSVAEEGKLTFQGADGADMVGRSTRVGSLQWSVIAALPAADAFADVAQMKWLMLASLTVIGALGAVFALGFSPVRRPPTTWNFSRPVCIACQTSCQATRKRGNIHKWNTVRRRKRT